MFSSNISSLKSENNQEDDFTQIEENKNDIPNLLDDSNYQDEEEVSAELISDDELSETEVVEDIQSEDEEMSLEESVYEQTDDINYSAQTESIEDEEPIVEPLISADEEQEQIEAQVSKDVDRMFYEKIEDNEPDDFAYTSEDLTEDDLNIIEDMKNDEIPLAGELEDAVPPIEDEEQPPVVPIYPADDIEDSDTQEFQPGDHVTTAKYGEGVVEKMIKYGNKMLCSIDFPSLGRKLLDPAMTEITKI